MRRYTPDYLLIPFSARDGAPIAEAFSAFRVPRRGGADYMALGYVSVKPSVSVHVALPDILNPAILEAAVRESVETLEFFNEYLLFDLRKLDFSMICGMLSDRLDYKYEILSTDTWILPSTQDGGADTVLQVVTGC